MARGHYLFIGATAIAASALLSSISVSAMDLKALYEGKTVTILYGYGSGGTYGKTSLLLTRHLGRFIPGQPTFIAQSMPGAGASRPPTTPIT